MGNNSNNRCTCTGDWTGLTCATAPTCGTNFVWSAPNCVCDAGWFTGDATCQTALLVCANGGAYSSSGTTQTCTCNGAWTGTDCSVEPTCGTNQVFSGTTCICATGWFGANCNTPLVDCGTYGVAVASTNTCTCLHGYSGATCQTQPTCAVNSFWEVVSLTCACSTGWMGTNCAVAIPTISAADPCGNNPCGANGVCTVSGSTASCACTGGWRGTYCAQEQQYFA